jgi:hypothetical protein
LATLLFLRPRISPTSFGPNNFSRFVIITCLHPGAYAPGMFSMFWSMSVHVGSPFWFWALQQRPAPHFHIRRGPRQTC